MNAHKKPYPYNDQVLFENVEEGDIHFQVLSNEKGTFVDIRKYFSDKPSRKGIRMPIEVFEKVYKSYVNSDYNKVKDEDSKEVTISIESDKKVNAGIFKKVKK